MAGELRGLAPAHEPAGDPLGAVAGAVGEPPCASPESGLVLSQADGYSDSADSAEVANFGLKMHLSQRGVSR